MKKLMMTVVLAAGAVFELSAMPTKAETERAEPRVQKKLASEQAALKEGKMTRAEVAEAAMKLAAKADTDAEKLLLMKGAFSLYVKDGNLEKAVETMKALKVAIPDLSPEHVTNMADTALQGADKNVDGARLRQLLAEAKVLMPQETVNGYTWSYQAKDGEATIAGEGGKYRAAVSPSPAGHVDIPSVLGNVKVTGVGVAAFYQCDKLTSVTIPESVTNIGHGAFQSCSGLKAVTIPSKVRNIDKQAFWACGGLETVKMCGERPEIGFNAFEKCDKLKLIHVPANAKSWEGMKEWQGIPLVFDGKETIGDHTWQYFVKGGEATIAGEGGKYRAAVSPSPAGHVDIPSVLGNVKVTGVGVAAFYQCDKLTSVTIPESVTNIGHGAFQSCGALKAVTIPSKVRSIAKQAFWACGGLETVKMCGERPEIGFNAFEKCGKLKSIHVPAKAKSWAGMKEWQGIPLVFDAK